MASVSLGLRHPGQLGTPSATSTSNLNENSSSGSPASRSKTPCFSFAFCTAESSPPQWSLYSADLTVLWDRLDSLLRNCVHQIRSLGPSLDEVHRAVEEALISLPIRLGGLGILSYAKCAPHAYAAANELADTVLAQFFHQTSPPASRCCPRINDARTCSKLPTRPPLNSSIRTSRSSFSSRLPRLAANV